MDASLKDVSAISLFVEDLVEAKAFYQTVFGGSPIFEDGNSAVFNIGNTMINLLLVSAAHELIEPALVGTRQAGSRFQLSIFVDDVDAACARLVRSGIELLNGPIDRPWGMRTAAFADPAGHVWEVAQDISPPGAA